MLQVQRNFMYPMDKLDTIKIFTKFVSDAQASIM